MAKDRINLSDAKALIAEGQSPEKIADAFDIEDDSAAPGAPLVAGNIDLHSRPVVHNPDGTISTVRSKSFSIDGKETLLPTISDDGRNLSDQETVDLFKRTGRHLGIFANANDATAYAQQLHEQQAVEYATPQAARVANVLVARARQEAAARIRAAGGSPIGGATRPGEPITAGDVAGSVGRGLLGLAQGIAAPLADTDPLHLGDAVHAGERTARYMINNPDAGGEAQAVTAMIPIVGEPIADLAGPAISARNREPTHEEITRAIQAGTSLLAMAAAPAVAKRVANVMRANGVAPAEAAAPAPELSDVRIDRLAEQARLGNPVRDQVPQKLQEALTSGEVNGDIASIRQYLVENPDVAREVSATYETTRGAAAPSPPEALAAPPALAMADAANPLPTPEAVVGAAKKFAPLKELADAAAPASASPAAATAADILRKSKAEIANDAAIERAKNKDVAKTFSQAGDASNIENISTYEKTGQFKDAPAGYSEMYKATTDAAHQSLQETYGDDRVGYVDNYVRRAFKFGSAADEAKASGVLSNWIGSLSASKSPLKGRVLSVPLDEALSTMRASGIDVKPATTNPEILRQWTVENANQARVYKQAWDDAKGGDLIQFVKQGSRVPDGMVELNDRVAKVFRPTDEGMVQTGKYFAEPGVARIFNNAISKGLGGSPTFRAIRSMNNAYNQVQLGLSAFHLTGTAINAGISDLSLGLQQLMQGDVAGGAKSVGRSAVPAYSFVRDMVNGRQFINGLLTDDPVARQILEEKLNPAGGRLAIDQAYRNTAYEKMTEAWSNRRYVRAIGNAPLAVIQKVASPLMEYAIPRVKIGAFLDLAEAAREKLGPDATPQDIQRAYERSWDSIDNRFGQLVHDNLFWNRTAADLAQVSTRSVGWNLGTIRELGGGITDILSGKLTPRALYSFALPAYAGMVGAIYMYLHTGKMPQTTRDYFYPQNGLTDNKGRADRVALPTYMKDVFAYSQDPVGTLEHKASPLLSMAFDLGTNRDYFGDMIRNPEDPLMKRRLADGAYILKQLRPFSISQAINTAGEPGGAARAGEQFFGFTKAPARMKMTSDEYEAASRARQARNAAIMARAAARHP